MKANIYVLILEFICLYIYKCKLGIRTVIALGADEFGGRNVKNRFVFRTLTILSSYMFYTSDQRDEIVLYMLSFMKTVHV